MENGSASWGGDATDEISTVRRLMLKCREETDVARLVRHLDELIQLLKSLGHSHGLYFDSDIVNAIAAEEVVHNSFAEWLRSCFKRIIALLYSLIDSSNTQLQVVGLRFLLRTIRRDANTGRSDSNSVPNAFPMSIYQTFVSKILQVGTLSVELQQHLLTEYLRKHPDLRFYFLIALRKILQEYGRTRRDQTVNTRGLRYGNESIRDTREWTECAGPDNSSPSGTSWYVWVLDDDELSSRVAHILIGIPSPNLQQHTRRKRKVPEPSSDSSEGGNLSCAESNESRNERERRLLTECYISNLRSTRAVNAAEYRSLYENVWVLFLNTVPHKKPVVQILLRNVPKVVLPFAANPLLFANFFLKAFNDSKRLSMCILALSGMFYLVARHRLGDVTLSGVDRLDGTLGGSASNKALTASAYFYSRLYHLIKPAALSPNLRVRFLRLLNVAMRSPLLPASLLCIFIKKCCRVACLVPPPACLSLKALIHSLLRRHYATCKPLIHLPPHIASSYRIQGDAFCFESTDDSLLDAPHDSNAFETEFDHLFAAMACEAPRQYIVRKEDLSPLVSRGSAISLWELDLLRCNVDDSVRQLTSLMDADLSSAGAPRVSFDDFLSLSSGSLVSRELRMLHRCAAPDVVPALIPMPRSASNLFDATTRMQRSLMH